MTLQRLSSSSSSVGPRSVPLLEISYFDARLSPKSRWWRCGLWKPMVAPSSNRKGFSLSFSLLLLSLEISLRSAEFKGEGMKNGIPITVKMLSRALVSVLMTWHLSLSFHLTPQRAMCLNYFSPPSASRYALEIFLSTLSIKLSLESNRHPWMHHENMTYLVSSKTDSLE